MFLGNLSNVSEQKARKTQVGSNNATFKGLTVAQIFALMESDTSSSDGAAASGGGGGSSSATPVVPFKKSGEARMTIKYTSDSAEKPSKELISDFFTSCCKHLVEEEVVKAIITESTTKNIPLHIAAMEYQRDILEFNYGIERDFGCKYLSRVASVFPDDPVIVDLSQNFIYTALKSYVLQVKVRAHTLYMKQRLKISGGVDRNSILEFFEGCNALMSLKETKKYLRDLHASGKQIYPVVVELQRNILTLLGFDATYACSCLDKIGEVYQNDSELMQKMQQFAMCAQTTAKEAMMSDDERASFYAECPKEMQHFPYLYVMHQQQQMMMRQQEMRSQRATGVPPGLAILQTPEGREKFVGLMERITTAKEIVDSLGIASWTDEEKKDYFTSFQSRPFIESLHATGTNAPARISAFLDLGEDDITAAITMQVIMATDVKNGGSIGKAIMDAQAKMWQAAAAASKSGDMEHAAAVAHEEGGRTIEGKVGSVLATLGSITNYGRTLRANTGMHDHNHSHDHVHGPDCKHGLHGGSVDVSSGKVEKMDR